MSCAGALVRINLKSGRHSDCFVLDAHRAALLSHHASLSSPRLHFTLNTFLVFLFYQ